MFPQRKQNMLSSWGKSEHGMFTKTSGILCGYRVCSGISLYGGKVEGSIWMWGWDWGRVSCTVSQGTEGVHRDATVKGFTGSPVRVVDFILRVTRSHWSKRQDQICALGRICKRGAWVAQSVKPTLDFGWGHDLPVCEFEPCDGLCGSVLTVQSLLGILSLRLSLSALSQVMHVCSLFLSLKINK